MKNTNIAYKIGSFLSFISERITYWSNEKNYSNSEYIILNLIVVGASAVNLTCMYFSYFLKYHLPHYKIIEALSFLIFISFGLINATFATLSFIKVVFCNHRPNYLKRLRKKLAGTPEYPYKKEHLAIAFEIADTEKDTVDHTAMCISFLKYGNFYIAFILILWKSFNYFRKYKRSAI